MKESEFAVIFDMDGVMVDNSEFHKKAWREFCRRHGFSLTDEEMKAYVYGRINPVTLRYIFKRELSKAELDRYVREKETLYREAFKPHLKPVKGLLMFLDELNVAGIRLAVATAASPRNVDFVLNGIGAMKYFKVIVDAAQYTKSKPDPEVYLTAAKKLGVKPSRCVVFEDSVSGVQAARNAGMKVVGVTTTHKESELPDTDMNVKDFTDVTVNAIKSLFA